jgi:hypothetical protein
VIVRISSEGQYDVPDDAIAELNKLDNAAVDACGYSDEAHFRKAFDQLLDLVRAKGTPVPDDDLYGSDIILPPPDVSLAEAKEEFQGEGLIPG